MLQDLGLTADLRPLSDVAGVSRPPLMILLDVTRSIRRVRHAVPSGIDRVEQAYLTWALSTTSVWLIAQINGRYHLVPPARARFFKDALTTDGRLDAIAWLEPWRNHAMRQAESVLRRHAAMRLRPAELESSLKRLLPRGATYINVGHANLTVETMRSLGRAGLARMVMLHDMIPIDLEDTCRPGTKPRFLRMLAASREADTLLCNSTDTWARVQKFFSDCCLSCPKASVLPLGINPPLIQSSIRSGSNHFVMLGTIEPRKNHAMVLAIWSEFWTQRRAKSPPHLHIIGRRGWKNAAVFETLDTHPMCGAIVHEHNSLDDGERDDLLSDACALLMPSLAEGYGLPVGEALSAGLPVIASDLPALRELGQGVPDWLEPQNCESWSDLIQDFAEPNHPRRLEQLARLQKWHRPNWQTHFDKLEEICCGFVEERGRD